MAGVYEIFPNRRQNFFSGLSVTLKLILINVACFVISLFILGIYGEAFFTNNFALTPSLILSGKSFWTIFTSIFMHGGFFHLFANMFSLFFVGTFLERIIGRKRFFWVYIISGLMGSIFYVVATVIFGTTTIPAVGASGAIFGLLGVLAFLVPYSRISLLAGPLILIVLEFVLTPFLPANISSILSSIINILFLVMIFSMFSFNSSFRKLAVPIELPMWLLPIIAIVPLSIISFFVSLPIGNSAHLGGLVAGLIYGIYLRKKFPNKTRMISKRFS